MANKVLTASSTSQIWYAIIDPEIHRREAYDYGVTSTSGPGIEWISILFTRPSITIKLQAKKSTSKESLRGHVESHTYVQSLRTTSGRVLVTYIPTEHVPV